MPASQTKSNLLFYAITALIIVMGFAFSYFNWKTHPNNVMLGIQKEIQATGKEEEAAFNKLDSTLRKIVATAEVSVPHAITLVDSIYKRNPNIVSNDINHILFLTCNILMRADSIDLALRYLQQAGHQSSLTRKTMMAGCYVKKGMLSEAESLLRRVAAQNQDNLWLLGNWHEVNNNKTLAIHNYQKLYVLDTVTYSQCQKRITELNEGAKPFRELQFPDFYKIIGSYSDPDPGPMRITQFAKTKYREETYLLRETY